MDYEHLKEMPSITDIFRLLFGSSKERLDTNELPRDIQQDFDNLYGRKTVPHWEVEHPDYHEEWIIYDGHNPEQGGLEHFFHSSQSDFLQEFDQMFQNIFGRFLGDLNLPSQAIPPRSPSEGPQENIFQHPKSLRDRMLKGPDTSQGNDNLDDQLGGSQLDGHLSPPSSSMFGDFWRLPFAGLRYPDQRADVDLDSQVEMGTHSLDDILAQKENDQGGWHISPSSSSSSFSSVTIVDSDGISETKTTRRDYNGEEEVTITRRIGDQLHTVTRRKDSSGNEETEEDTVNIDRGRRGRHDFNEKWQNSKRSGESFPHLSDGSASNPQSSLFSIVESLMEDFFPRRR